MTEKLSAIIVAGGTGSRMGTDIPKQFIKIFDKEIILYTIESFLKCDFVDSIVIVCHEDYLNYCKSLVSAYDADISVVCGGTTRQLSVYNGLMQVKNSDYVFVHDAVRCLVSHGDMKKLYKSLKEYGSSALAVRAKDTIKIADEENMVISTPKRETLWQVQTPQAFATNELIDAHKYAMENAFAATDDCSVMEYFGKSIRLVEGNYENIKITTPSDILIAEAFMKGGR